MPKPTDLELNYPIILLSWTRTLRTSDCSAERGITGGTSRCPSYGMKMVLMDLGSLHCFCYFQGISQQIYQLIRPIDSCTNTDVSSPMSHTVKLGLFVVYGFSHQ